MKKVLFFILSILLLSLTGCVKMIDITDEESEQIARASAWLLLRYDNNYTENITSPTPIPDFSEEEEPEEFVEEAALPTPTPTDIPQKDEETDKTQETLSKLPQENISVQDLINSSPWSNSLSNDFQLTYDGYEFYDNYSFDTFSIDPSRADRKLFLIFLTITNSTEENRQINLMEMKPKIRLYADATQLLTPKKTVLMNDFQFLHMNFLPQESYNSVLVFEVGEDFVFETLDLYLSTKENVAHMNLQ